MTMFFSCGLETIQETCSNQGGISDSGALLEKGIGIDDRGGGHYRIGHGNSALARHAQDHFRRSLGSDRPRKRVRHKTHCQPRWAHGGRKIRGETPSQKVPQQRRV